jgi:hypothetical protein
VSGTHHAERFTAEPTLEPGPGETLDRRRGQ